MFEIIAEEHSKPIDSSLPFSNYYAHSSSSSLISLFLISHLDAEEEGELEPAKELIQPIAEKIMAKYKAKEEETPMLFFVAGEVCLSIYVCNQKLGEVRPKMKVCHLFTYLMYFTVNSGSGLSLNPFRV